MMVKKMTKIMTNYVLKQNAQTLSILTGRLS